MVPVIGMVWQQVAITFMVEYVGAIMKKFLIGFVVGVLIAFHLGINFGRHRPLLSNPYAEQVESVKERAGQVIESTKETIHEATEPGQKKLGR